jgi:hypothetical protein
MRLTNLPRQCNWLGCLEKLGWVPLSASIPVLVQFEQPLQNLVLGDRLIKPGSVRVGLERVRGLG